MIRVAGLAFKTGGGDWSRRCQKTKKHRDAGKKKRKKKKKSKKFVFIHFGRSLTSGEDLGGKTVFPFFFYFFFFTVCHIWSSCSDRHASSRSCAAVWRISVCARNMRVKLLGGMFCEAFKQRANNQGHLCVD